MSNPTDPQKPTNRAAKAQADPERRPQTGPAAGRSGASGVTATQPAQPRPDSSASRSDTETDVDPAVGADSETSRSEQLREKVRSIPTWGWVVAAVVVVALIVAIVSLPRGEKDSDSGSQQGDGLGQISVTYRVQLTQDGQQAGCYILMQGARAVGISCDNLNNK